MTTTETTRTASVAANSIRVSLSGVKPATDSHTTPDSQVPLAVGGTQTTPKTTCSSKPMAMPSSGSNLPAPTAESKSIVAAARAPKSTDSHGPRDTQTPLAVGSNSLTSHKDADAHACRAGEDQLPPAHTESEDHESRGGGTQTSRDDDTHPAVVVPAQTSRSGQRLHDSQRTYAAAGQTSDYQPCAVVPAQTSTTRHRLGDSHLAAASGGPNLPPDQVATDDQHKGVGRGQTSETPSEQSKTQITPGVSDQTPSSQSGTEDQGPPAAGPILRDPVLGVLADVLDDLESVRIANENRLRTLTADDEYGHGLTLAHPEIARLAAIVDVLKEQEHQAQLNLCRVMRKHPLWEFAKPLKGVGEKQFARLIAVVGDPYWNDLHDRPRTVSELRSYCGFGNAETQRRQRGQKANWNATARSRVWLIAESCMKQKESGQYRKVYDTARAHYADAIHTTECKRCGPAGKPAQPGTPLSLAHQHARGLRAIAKQLLKDLWLAAEAHRKEDAA